MKRIIIMSILAAMTLTACGAGQDSASQDAAGEAEIVLEGEGNYWTDEDLPVSMKTEYPAYLPDTETINADVTNRTDAELSYAGSKFTLYRVKNGKEKKVPYKKDGDNFTELACICPPQGVSSFTADLAAHYDLPLEEGMYVIRVGEVSADAELYAGFEITADAAYVQEAQTENAVSVNMISADAESMTVSIQNDADTPYVFSRTQLSLEHTDEMSASCAAYTAEDAETEIPPHSSTVLTLQAADFGSGEPLADGTYVLMLDNIRAEFRIGGEVVK